MPVTGPKSDDESRHDKLTTNEFCDECKAKRKHGNCKLPRKPRVLFLDQ